MKVSNANHVVINYISYCYMKISILNFKNFEGYNTSGIPKNYTFVEVIGKIMQRKDKWTCLYEFYNYFFGGIQGTLCLLLRQSYLVGDFQRYLPIAWTSYSSFFNKLLSVLV